MLVFSFRQSLGMKQDKIFWSGSRFSAPGIDSAALLFHFLQRQLKILGLFFHAVVITEFGWEYQDVPSVSQAFNTDLPWASELYAPHPEILGAAIWYLGPGFGGIANQAQQYIEPMTEYAATHYFPYN